MSNILYIHDYKPINQDQGVIEIISKGTHPCEIKLFGTCSNGKDALLTLANALSNLSDEVLVNTRATKHAILTLMILLEENEIL